MTPAEARDQLQKALAAARPQCFVPVSQQALEAVLEMLLEMLDQLQPEESSDERQEKTD